MARMTMSAETLTFMRFDRLGEMGSQNPRRDAGLRRRVLSRTDAPLRPASYAPEGASRGVIRWSDPPAEAATAESSSQTPWRSLG